MPGTGWTEEGGGSGWGRVGVGQGWGWIERRRPHTFFSLEASEAGFIFSLCCPQPAPRTTTEVSSKHIRSKG